MLWPHTKTFAVFNKHPYICQNIYFRLGDWIRSEQNRELKLGYACMRQLQTND